MDSLQIQDAFAPYYAGGKPAKTQAVCKQADAVPGEKTAISAADVRARLEACRERLARAIAAEKKGR
jgi:hypothetical protein